MTDALMPTLRECPFCGGPAHLQRNAWYVWAKCNACGAARADSHMSDEGAAESWNTRAPQPGKAEGEGWVACERMPPFGVSVIVAQPGEVYGEARRNTFHPCGWEGMEEGHAIEGVTHWHPLPSPPVEPGRGGETG